MSEECETMQASGQTTFLKLSGKPQGVYFEKLVQPWAVGWLSVNE